MKKILFGLAIMSYAGVAFAGEYHSGAQLVCSDCHTMHDSRSHSFNSFSDQFVGGLGTRDFATQPSVGHHYLLVQSTVEGTCLACHNGQTFAPDVFAAATAQTTTVTGGLTTPDKRSAGAIDEAGATIDGYTEDMGHSMGAKVLPPGYNNTDVWTGATAEGFHCADCHTPHGNGAYRNLVNKYSRLASPATTLVAPTPPTYAKATAQDLTKDVTILATANSYDTDKVAFGNAVAGTPSKLNQLCAWCHGNFHGAGTVDANSVVIRHPTDATLSSAAHGAAVADGPQFTVVRPIRSATDAAGFVTNAEVACVSCHKAHGNGRGFALVYPNFVDALISGTSGTFTADVNLENGSDATVGVRSLCVSCHGMGKRAP